MRTGWTGIQGAPWLSTMYFNDALGAAAQDAVDAVGTFWGTLDAFMVPGAVWTTEAEVATVDVTTGQITGITTTTPATGAGTGSANPLPTATQGLIQWRTGEFVSGRELRGRTFIPALDENASSGNPSGTFASAAPAAAAALIADADSELIIYSPTHATLRAVTSGALWSSFAVLRSRRD